MKRKVLLLFILALVTLVIVGWLGRFAINRSIRSIEEASAPNQKLTLLREVFQELLDAESSVRTYTITENRNSLNSFGDAAYNVDSKLNELRVMTTDTSQFELLARMDSLIEKKFETLKRLIQLKEAGADSSVLDKIRADIELLRKKEVPQELSTIRDLYTDEENDEDDYEKLFGASKEDEKASDSLYGGSVRQDLSSEQVDEALARLSQEQSQSARIRKQRELSYTNLDNKLMEQIRSTVKDFETTEELITVNRTERLTRASENAKTFISTVMVIALVLFAVMLLIIFRDISRNQRNREQLRLAKEHAEKLARVKEDFLSNMSHEIRTPLNAVIGFTEQLAASPLGDKERSFVERIQRSGKHLLHLINDILDYAKLESGKVKLENVGFVLKEQLDDAISLFATQASERNLYLKSEIDTSVPEILKGDPVRFSQILINLISNAIKFTRKGGITVTISSEALSRERIMVHISVKDTGVGIAEEKLTRIFQEFEQADSSTTREYGGTGLGLSIVRKITEAHNGSLEVESEVNRGTTFLVSIPYDVGSEPDLPASEKTDEKLPEVAGRRILVVDDQEFNRELVETILTRWGMAVTTCGSGKEALETAETEEFDMILMDIQMPGMSGLEVVRNLRESHGINANIPVVALTAGSSEKEKQESFDAGMDGVLLKPFTQDNLRKMLEQFLNGAITEINGKQENDIDLSDLQNLSNGDDTFIINMLEIFLTNNRSDFRDLENAIQEMEVNRIRALSHKMIPPCRHLGFEKAAGLLREMEHAAEASQEGQIRAIHKKLSIEINKIYPQVEQELRKFTGRPASSAL